MITQLMQWAQRIGELSVDLEDAAQEEDNVRMGQIIEEMRSIFIDMEAV